MKNKYLIIKADGAEMAVADYLHQGDVDADFKVFIEKEALGKSGQLKSQGKSDYLQIAHKLGFKWEENSDIGFINYDHKASLIMRLVKEYSRKLVNEIGFPIYEVSGSNFFDMQHPVVQAYAGLFGDRLFYFQPEESEKKLVMSYDASYPQFNLAKNMNLSYKHLPLAHYSLSDCYRYEQSGECMLLVRGRRFNMPDLHPYFPNLESAFEWYERIEAKIVEAANEGKREYFNLVKVSSLKNWGEYKNFVKGIAQRRGKDLLVEIRMDGEERYWIVDVDYSIIDSLGQPREIGCIQIDLGNAKRIGISFKDNNGKKQYPIIIHSAVPGGLERYIYMLIDRFADFPYWLRPVQLRLVPVSEKYVDQCERIAVEYADRLRIDIADSSESVSRRIKKAHEDLVPEVIVIGENELDFGGVKKEIWEQVNSLAKQNNDKPFLPLPWPIMVSKQV